MQNNTAPISVRYFPTSKAAWAFMRECDAAGITAGYPSLKPTEHGYSVQYIAKQGI